MTGRGCEQFREVAPELALGIAEGDERAKALDHLEHCAACRRVLDELTRTVDALVVAGPTAEPPSGFEVRALDAFGVTDRATELVTASPGADGRAPPGRSHRRWLAAAAVVALLVIAAGVLVQWQLSSGSSPTAVASELAGPIETADGTSVGSVWVDYDADPHEAGNELIVTLGDEAPAGTYRVQCDYESGGPYDAGTLTVGEHGARWSTEVSVPTYDLSRVRLISTDGNENLEAQIAG